MVKSEVKKVEKGSGYPKLMEGSDGFVVLFSNYNTGTVVIKCQSSHPVGYHSMDWIPGKFKPFTGTIELSNV